MSRLAWFVLPAVALLAGCGPKPAARSQALLVTVTFDPGATSRCVRVLATPASGTPGETAPISKTEDALSIAVFRAPDWSEQVTLVARGYASCAEGDFIESSDSVTRSFPPEGAEGVALVVRKKPVVGTDADGDGKSGAEDCDDNDPERFVGNAEPCNSSKDNNCSLSTGCVDPLCTGACSPSGQGSCQQGLCTGSTELLCDDQGDNDGDTLIDCADQDCFAASCSDGTACTTGDVCRSDGGCAGAPIAVSCAAAPGSCFLAPGTCNPFDGGCVFAVKDAGTLCNDNNACTQSERCTATGDCGGPTMTTTVCSSPPNSQCYASTGACNVLDGGCSYTPVTGGCNDGQLCTDNDTCSNGSCVGTPKVCFQSSDPCKLDAGSCEPSTGACAYSNAPNTNTCNDNDGCTQLDRCNNGSCIGQNPVTCAPLDVCHDAGTCSTATGACSSPTVSCSPRNECESAGACVVANGGCSYVPTNDGGACNSGTGTCQAGTCVPSFIPFDGSPPASNFAPDAGRMPTEGLNITCAAVLNTSAAMNTATFNACGRTLSSVDGGLEIFTQGGVQTVLVRAAALFIADGGSITVTGARPAILAIYGNASIGGVISASAAGIIPGPGAEQQCNAAPAGTKNNNAGGSAGGGGAFGATGGLGGPGEGTAQSTPAATASGNDALTPLRGGCRGAEGGSENTIKPIAGGGGGAVQISVAGRLRVWGTIVANGGGGLGGGQSGAEGDGAGGGGSGGAILLEADDVVLESTARLFANGGSGGEGGDSAQSSRGQDGNDGILAYGVTASGAGTGNGTNGGAGGGGATPSGANVGSTPPTDDGGGGGGGSMGRVRINYASGCRENNYVISPSNAATTPTPAAGTGFTTNTGSIFAIGAGGSCP